MLERLRSQIGTAGLIVAIVALVAALGGGAYAATSNSGQATASAKGKQGKQGPRGKTGKAGPAGPAGAQGLAGPAGVKGDKGDAGATGATGAQGPAGPAGAAGKNGTTGFTVTLPGGETETGSWAMGMVPSGNNFPQRMGISFPIPLGSGLPGSNVHYVKVGETAPAGCTGGTPATPIAEPGHFCVYETFNSFLTFGLIYDPSTGEIPGTGATGAILRFSGEEGQAFGTWAVTAEDE
jgi:hypothetical protein